MLDRRKFIQICQGFFAPYQLMGAGAGGGGGGATGATWNPSDKNNDITLSNGNLAAITTNAVAFRSVRSTTSKASGAWYFEIKRTIVGDAGAMFCGIADNTTAFPQSGNGNFNPGSFDNSVGCRRDFSAAFGIPVGMTIDVATNFGGSDTLNDVYMFAVDVDNFKVWKGLNGTWIGSVTPVVGAATQWAHWTSAISVFACVGLNAPTTSPQGTIQTASGSLSFSPPSGFTAWG